MRNFFQLIVIFPFLISAQSNDGLSFFFSSLNKWEFEKCNSAIKNIPLKYREDCQLLLRLIENNDQILNSEIKSQVSTIQSSDDANDLQIIISKLINSRFKLLDKDFRANVYEMLMEAKSMSESIDSKSLKKFILLEILRLYHKGIIHNDDSFVKFLRELKRYSNTPEELLLYNSYKFNLYSQTTLYNSPLHNELETMFEDVFSKLNDLKVKIPNDKKINLLYHYDYGNYLIWQDPAQAMKHYQKALNYCDSTIFYNPHKFNIYLQMGRAYAQQMNYNKALEMVDLASVYKNTLVPTKDEFVIYGYKGEYHAQLTNYDSAYIYMKRSRYLEYELDFQQQNSQISKLEVENNVKQKEVENLTLKTQNLEMSARNTRIRNLLIVSVITIFIIGGLSYFWQLNTAKKRKIAEQEATIGKQKLESALKEQELKSIDAMIAGQEKERQKVANELHDDLGSLMATIKLHFDQTKSGEKNEALQQAQNLLDEAYTKIRGMAHTKNSGVMSDQGLLPAVQKMAEVISQANQLEISVEHYGMGERMENSLELTIFRIIQELTTNILKHAKATTANIQLTQHEDNLNIIIADNGVGFNFTEAKNKNGGMGLDSIEKRIEHLEGNFTIDSVIGKGTSILIDIPV